MGRGRMKSAVDRGVFAKSVETSFGSIPGGFTATITTDAVDRDGEVLVPQGCNTKEYERNPTLTVAHMTASDAKGILPIGRCDKLTRTEKAIIGTFSFAKRPDGYVGEWFPDYVAGLVSAGALNAVSIQGHAASGGYRMASMGDRQKYGPDCQGVMSRWILTDVSLVPVPANQEALVSAVHKGYVSVDAAKRWGQVVIPSSAVPVAEPSRVPRSSAEVRVAAKRHVVRVTVPALGSDDIRKAVREEVELAVARIRGRVWI